MERYTFVEIAALAGLSVGEEVWRDQDKWELHFQCDGASARYQTAVEMLMGK